MTTTATLISNMQAEIAELRAESERMENLLAMDVHSCGPTCTKSPCVNRRLRDENEALQARIDELMLEYCPDDMTKEQFDNWAVHQVPVMKGQ